jgi:hypothetical protein
MATIPVIASADDIDAAIVYAHRRPEARWYVARRAEALGVSNKIPQKWGITAAGPPQAVREKAADKGQALPDGSFPIRNKEDLAKAVKAFGRAKDKAKAKRHIIKRARALKAVDTLPESWGVTATGALVAASIRGMARKIKWDPALHPRGRDGRFIEKGGSVDIFEGAGFRTPEARGRAVGVRREGDNELVQVEITTAPTGGEYKIGDTVEVDTENLEAGPEQKARLDEAPEGEPEPDIISDDTADADLDRKVDAVYEALDEMEAEYNPDTIDDTVYAVIDENPDMEPGEVAMEVSSRLDLDAPDLEEEEDSAPSSEFASEEEWRGALYDELTERGVNEYSIDDVMSRVDSTPYESGQTPAEWADENLANLDVDEIEYEGEEDDFVEDVRATLDARGVEGIEDGDIVELYRSNPDLSREDAADALASRNAETPPPDAPETEEIVEESSYSAYLNEDGTADPQTSYDYFKERLTEGYGPFDTPDGQPTDEQVKDYISQLYDTLDSGNEVEDADLTKMLDAASGHTPEGVEEEVIEPGPAPAPEPIEGPGFTLPSDARAGDTDPRAWTGRKVDVQTRDGQVFTGGRAIVRRERDGSFTMTVDDQPVDMDNIATIEEWTPNPDDPEAFIRPELPGENEIVLVEGFPAAPIGDREELIFQRTVEEIQAAAGNRARLRKMLNDWRKTKRASQARAVSRGSGPSPEDDRVERQIDWRIALLEKMIADIPSGRRSTTASGAEDPRETLRRRVYGD